VNVARTLSTFFDGALAQRIVAFRREAEEHVKESQLFSKRPSLAAKGVDCEPTIPPLRQLGRAPKIHFGVHSNQPVREASSTPRKSGT
jgi:hypothetical protein